MPYLAAGSGLSQGNGAAGVQAGKAAYLSEGSREGREWMGAAWSSHRKQREEQLSWFCLHIQCGSYYIHVWVAIQTYVYLN